MNGTDETRRARRLLLAVVLGIIVLNTIILILVFWREVRGNAQQPPTPTNNSIETPVQPPR